MSKSLSVLLLLLHFSLLAQPALQNDLPLKYLVQQPSVSVVHPPVIILLHGYGSNEADLFELKNKLPANFLVIAARAPFTIGQDAYQWFRMETVNGAMQGNTGDLKTSREKIRALIIAAVKKYHADPQQVYLCGFSQGAMMSYETGLTNPQLLKGIAPLSGKIFESLKSLVQQTPALKKLHIFIGHGDADNRVPYSFATEAVSYLEQMHVHPVLHTYKGMSHSISETEINDLVQWLKEK